MMARKTGKPRALEEDPELNEQEEGQSPEQFAAEMFGQADKPQEGLPSLEFLKENYQTKSAAIRYLVSLNIPIKVIAKHLGVKYQHARNVATNVLKRGPNEDWRPKAERPTSTQPLYIPPPKKES